MPRYVRSPEGARIRVRPGPDPTFDPPPTRTEAKRMSGATMSNYARELSNAVDTGEVSQAMAESKLKRAAGVLPER